MLCLPVEGSVVSMIEQMEQPCHLTEKQYMLPYPLLYFSISR